MMSFNIRIKYNQKRNLNLSNLKNFSLTFNFILLLLMLNITKFITIVQSKQTIILKIKGTGYQHKLTPEPDKDHGLICPNNTYINDILYEKHNDCDPLLLTDEESTIKMEWDIKVILFNMFKGMTNVTEIDLSNFDISHFENLNMMFENCISLKSVKFGSLKSSNIKNLNSMFKNCISLTSVDLSFLGDSILESMGNVFYNCISLLHVNLSGLDTSKVVYMDNMFNNCTSLS